MSLIVKHGRERRVPSFQRFFGASPFEVDERGPTYHLPFSPHTPLGTLRAELARLTSLPAAQFKLVSSGAVLKDDSLPLSSYSLRDGSTLILLTAPSPSASHPSQAQPAQPAQPTGPPSEESIIAHIHSLYTAGAAPLVPEIEEFERTTYSLSPSSTSPAAPAPSIPPPTQKDLDSLSFQHRKLSELLLQGLLKLDSVALPAGFDEARKERKESVRKTQGLLDRVDRAGKGLERVAQGA